MQPIETDESNGITIFQLTDDPRPVDNIYGEQPYCSDDGKRIALRFYADGERDGELAILDLEDLSLQTIIDHTPRHPAFHGWGSHLYCLQQVGDDLILRRWNWHTGIREDVVFLPPNEGQYGYGTVSADERHYAVSIIREDGSRAVMHFDLSRGDVRLLADARGADRPGEANRAYHFKHEQFGRDGSNRLLIQANVIPSDRDVPEAVNYKLLHGVHLGVLTPDQPGMQRLACDEPLTPQPTGHEAWIGTTTRIFFSTAYDSVRRTNLFTVGLGDKQAEPVPGSEAHFGHVSVSRCGRYWVADAMNEDGIPIYAGRFGSMSMRRLVISRTVHDPHQWSHTHPYLTSDNRWLIFTSTRNGRPQVFGAQVPDEFWSAL